jgi:hypothetical protein
MLSRRPTVTAHNLAFALAGPRGAPPPYLLVGGSYVDADYQNFNPRYNRPSTQPVWGLSNPFPRVMRPGTRRGTTADDERTTVFPPNEVGSTQAAPQISKTAVRPDHANLQPDGSREITASRQDSPRGPGLPISKTPNFLRTVARVRLPYVLNRSVSAESGVLHLSRLTEWESQQIQQRLRVPMRTMPSHDPQQDLTRERVQEQDAANSLRTATTVTSDGPALKQQPDGEAAVDDARRTLQESADTADRDGALSHPPPNLEDPEYRRSVHGDYEDFFQSLGKVSPWLSRTPGRVSWRALPSSASSQESWSRKR